MRKKLLIIFGVLVLIVLIFIVWYFMFRTPRISVLTYHRVIDGAKEVDISKEYFDKQMKWLHDNGYKTLTMDEFYKWKKGELKLPRKSVLITFDDGWKSTYDTALPILEKYGLKATVFVVWRYMEQASLKNENTYMNLEDIKDVEENHKSLNIASHSYLLHLRENAESDKYKVYNKDIKKVKTFDEEEKYYAYPFGVYNDNYQKALKDNGYKLAFTFGPYKYAEMSDDDFAVARMGVFESTKFWKFKLKIFLQ